MEAALYFISKSPNPLLVNLCVILLTKAKMSNKGIRKEIQTLPVCISFNLKLITCFGMESVPRFWILEFQRVTEFWLPHPCESWTDTDTAQD